MSACTCACEHVGRNFDPNTMFLSKCTTVDCVAKAGSPGVGCVMSSTDSFTFLGLLTVPFLLGLTEALRLVVGVTAWAMPTAPSTVRAAAVIMNLRMVLLTGWFLSRPRGPAGVARRYTGHVSHEPLQLCARVSGDHGAMPEARHRRIQRGELALRRAVLGRVDRERTGRLAQPGAVVSRCMLKNTSPAIRTPSEARQ